MPLKHHLRVKMAARRGSWTEEIWLGKIWNEIAIMKENPHVSVTPSCRDLDLIIQKPNIMQVIKFYETLKPVFVMPYYPLGSLQDLKGCGQEQYRINSKIRP